MNSEDESDSEYEHWNRVGDYSFVFNLLLDAFEWDIERRLEANILEERNTSNYIIMYDQIQDFNVTQ